MKKKSKWGVVILLALIIIGIIVYPQLKKMSIAEDKEVSSAAPRSKGPQTLDIEAEILLPQQLIDNTIVTGSTIPDEQVDMAFESSGKIVGIFFKEGAHIQKGQLLAKINDKPLQAELQKLEAQIPLAKERVYRQHTLLQ